MTSPSQPTWQDQWQRVQRWYADLQRTYAGRPASDGGTDWLRDHALAFFVFAYHLADWIDHDETVADKNDKALSFATHDDHLKWCRDLCNATKHLVLGDPNGSVPRTLLTRR